MTNPILTSALFIGLTSCSSTKATLGTYRSNFAQLDSQITTLVLKPDSTFEYIIKGNLIYDSSFGKYQIWEHRLLLSKIWEKTGPYRWSMLERSPKIYISGRDSMEYQTIFYFGDNRLYYVNFETGKKITKTVGYNERKKYIFFGTHYYKKNWYLIRS